MKLEDFQRKQNLRDKPLHFRWIPEDSEALLQKLHDNFDFPKIRIKLRACALVGLAIIAARNTLQGHFTSYSRRNDFYTGKKELYDCRYFTRTHIKEAFADTANSNMFVNLIESSGSYYPPSELYKPQSAFIATPELIEVVRDTPVTYKQNKPVIVKDVSKLLAEIEETAFSVQRRRDIDEINDFYRSDLNLSFDESFRQFGNVYKVGSDWKEIRPLQVSSIFNDRSWKRGGRLYHYMSNMRKETRSHLLINGENTTEIDYTMMQPTLLFQMVGKQIDRDIYSLGCHYGLDEKQSRDLHKQAFAAALNGNSLIGAAHSICEKSPELGLTYRQAGECIQRLITATPEIDDLLFQQKGLLLQRKDSDIIVSVLKKLIKSGIPAISYHDSVVAPVRYQGHVRDVMLDTFSEYCPGFSISVK